MTTIYSKNTSLSLIKFILNKNINSCPYLGYIMYMYEYVSVRLNWPFKRNRIIIHEILESIRTTVYKRIKQNH